MGGTRPIESPGTSASAPCSSATVRTVLTAPSPPRGRGRAARGRASAPRAPPGGGRPCPTRPGGRGVALDRVQIAPGDRAGEFEAVVDYALHQRAEAGGRSADGVKDLRGHAVQGDEVVGRDRGAGVVERAIRLVELEGLEPEQQGGCEGKRSRRRR